MQYHYAKVGFGVSEYRTNRSGEVPVGLIEMQSPPPHYDWIANADGSYSEAPRSTDELFTEEMVLLNTQYESDTQKAINKVASAMAWDGVTESVKVANARAELAQLKTNYDTQSLAIINKYYGA